MQIGDVFGQLQNALSGTRSTTQVENGGRILSGSGQQVLQPGNVFEGTVSANTDGQVTIKLSNGQSLNATLAQGVNVKIGEPLFFEVKGTNDLNQTEIRLYQGSVTNNPTISSALRQAGLQVNPTTVTMVQTMMENQMAIDKQSLLSMVKQVADYPQAQVTTLVNMTKVGLPITNASVAQFENYTNDQHAVVLKMESMMQEIPELLSGDTLSKSQTANLALDILDAFRQTGLTAETLSATQPQAIPEGEALAVADSTAEGGMVPEERAAAVEEPAINPAQTAEPTGTTPMSAVEELANMPQAVHAQTGEMIVGEANAEETVSVNQTAGETPVQAVNHLQEATLQGLLQEEGAGNANTNLLTESVAAQLSEPELTSLNQTLQSLVASHPEVLTLLDAQGELRVDATGAQFLNTLTTLLENPESLSKEQLGELLSSKAFRGTLSNIMQRQWMISPQDVQVENRIHDLYERLDRQMEQFQQAFAKVDTPETNALAKQASDLRENISFLNQINQTYAYVQIPLRLMNQNVNSDLYVFSNKQKMEDDGTLTAFLHLDMEHLGSTDVSIRMQDKNVSTHFFMENEAAFDLIEANIDILTHRLQDKGYHVTMQVENDTQSVDFVEDFLKQGQSVGAVHRYSFDVKA